MNCMLNLKGIAAAACAILLSCVVSADPAKAAVVASYGFTGGSFGSPNLVSTDTDLGTTASDLGAGAGANLNSSGAGNPARSLFLNNSDSADEASAIADSSFYTFTITPGAFPLDLMSIDFEFQRDDLDGISTYSIRSDAGGDNFATQLFEGAIAGGTTGISDFFAQSAPLSSVASLQGLNSATELRLYFFGATAGSNVAARLDNLVLNGTAIPEPSSFAMLLGSGAIMLRRRKR